MAAGTINYDHSPNDVVWHITDDCGVKKATVLRVDGIVDTTGTNVIYRIQYFDASGAIDVTTYLYAEADIATAMADYQTMLLA